ncbi:MAG TPA: acetoacetate decarboxylase family protein [Burkholderiaceae bacterium]|nr:acetoacetate decarboxylase family protein [Burkholderiaceae bacterium]
MSRTFPTFSSSRPRSRRRLMPRHLAPGDRSVVYVNRLRYRGIDYLAGRGYEEFVVAVNARHEHNGKVINAPYVVCVWVDEIPAILSGREALGYPKLYADIPQVIEYEGKKRYSASEYGKQILSGEVRNLRELPESALPKINASVSEYNFAWKYIQGPEDTIDADYITLTRMSWDYKRAWMGEGETHFHPGTFEEVPASSAALKGLAALPVLGWQPAFVANATAIIYREETKRLESMNR